MVVTQYTKRALAFRREARKLESLGYRRHETDWQLHRGDLWNPENVIVDAKISQCGKYVYTKIGKRA